MLFFVTLASYCTASAITGTVVSVHDGDTLRVRGSAVWLGTCHHNGAEQEQQQQQQQQQQMGQAKAALGK
jgi:endonuclease YncB( thermonuclease family)